jgi:hypothetical protein
MPDDPYQMTPMEQNATMLHELYLNFTKAGFTAEQAMQLVIAAVSAGFRSGQ